MAMQWLFSFSSSAEGAAVAGGSIYGCGDQNWPQQMCYGIFNSNIQKADKYAKWRHTQGLIDRLNNLQSVPALLFNGKGDWLVYTAAMRDVKKQLEHYGAPNLTTHFETAAGHVWSVDHGTCTCGE